MSLLFSCIVIRAGLTSVSDFEFVTGSSAQPLDHCFRSADAVNTLTNGFNGFILDLDAYATPWYGMYRAGETAFATSDTALSTPQATAGSGTTQSGPLETSPQAGGLSTGAKAGIGVGASLGGIVIIAIAVFFIMRRTRNQKKTAFPVSKNNAFAAESSDSNAVNAEWTKAELSGEGNAQPTFDSQPPVHEAGGDMRPHEMDSPVRAELPADVGAELETNGRVR